MGALAVAAATLLALVAVHHAVSLAVVTGRHRDLAAWHVLMALVMTTMLVGAFPPWVAGLAFALSAIGLWCALAGLALGSTPGTYVRLGLGWVAMAVMVLPLSASSSAAAASPSPSAPGHHHAVPPGSGAIVPPAALALLVVVALVAVALLRAAAVLRPAGARVERVDAGCDVVMSAAMVAMVAASL